MYNKNDNSRDSNGNNCVNADLFASRFLNQTLTADKENLIKPKTPEKLKRRQSGGWAMTLTADQPLEKSQTDFLINESLSCPLVFLWLICDFRLSEQQLWLPDFQFKEDLHKFWVSSISEVSSLFPVPRGL